MLKRLSDITCALCALVLLSPALIVVALIIRLTLGAPILFRHRRPGRKGTPFTLLKFRTMTDQRDQHGQLLPEAQRMTALGRFLRSMSIDELPELINVIRGEMSLVGPRPLLLEYLDRYSPRQAQRHEVFPGLTGWAQVHGRNAVTWEKRLELDVWYVDNISLWLDVRILCMTVWQVFTMGGIRHEGYTTMPRFMGNEEDPHEKDGMSHDD